MLHWCYLRVKCCYCSAAFCVNSTAVCSLWEEAANAALYLWTRRKGWQTCSYLLLLAFLTVIFWLNTTVAVTRSVQPEISPHPLDCRILGGDFEWLRRRAGWNHSKLPQGTQHGWSCELSYLQPERAGSSLQIRTAIALPSEFGEEIVSQSSIVHLMCCLSTSSSTTDVRKVCFYGKSSD